MSELIRGAGGGGKDGGGSTRVPTEDPDSLRSRAYARVIDLISEGEIEGLVDGMKSIYLDDTPLQAADGSYNFSGVTVTTRNGTQAQDYIPGFAAVESEVAVSTEVKASQSVTRTINNANASAVRVTVSVPALTYQDLSTGDLTGTSVEIAIDINNNGGGWQEVKTDTISGKTTSRYQRSYRLDLPAPGPWQVRVRRITPDSTQANLRNQTYWDSYTEIIDAKLRYPNSALVAIQIDAAQFNRIPRRGYDIRGLRVRVPTNYDPITRGYAGVWNGSFKIAWTDNPAWCFYDLLTSERYGLGAYLDEAQIDKWALYEIGRYCDEFVPNGFGGTEPRFTCNLYLQTRQEAYTVIQQMAAIFRGMAWWSQGAITAVADRPADPVALFTEANVIEGVFTYSGASVKQRHTVALVTWNDPSDMYRQKIEYVEDVEGIRQWGVRETEVIAVGCTSRGQAHRVGRWLLYTERMETETVTFRTGLEGALVYPGAVIRVQDASRAGARFGGRIVAATASQVTLDAAVQIEAGKSYQLSVMRPDGTVETRAVTSGVGSRTQLSVSPAFSAAPLPASVWVLAASDLAPTTWRVVAAAEVETGIVEITALAHRPDKYAQVEQGLSLEPPALSPRDAVPGEPSEFNWTPAWKTTQGGPVAQLIVSWSARNAARYLVSVRGAAEIDAETVLPSLTIDGAKPGDYSIRVVAVSASARQSTPGQSSYTMPALIPGVTDPQVTLSAIGALFGIRVTAAVTGMAAPTDVLEIWRADNALLTGAMLWRAFPAQAVDVFDSARTGDEYWYRARIRHHDGSFTAWSATAHAQTLTDPQSILTQVQQAIASEHLASSLAERIDLIDAPVGVPGAVSTRLHVVRTEALGRIDAVSADLDDARAQASAALQQRLDDLGEALLRAQSDLSRYRDILRDAGIVVEPDSGKVHVYAVDQVAAKLSTVDLTLDAVKGEINQRATIAYVDNAIATAVIAPEQVPVFTQLETRISTAEQTLSAHDAAIAQKASLATTSAHEARITTAEQRLDAHDGQIAQKVDQATYTADQTVVSARLSSAESTLSALGDTASISQAVRVAHGSKALDDADAEATLRALLGNQAAFEQVAAVSQTAEAKITATNEALATARSELLAGINNNAAAIQTEQTARADADSALASSISQVQARLDTGDFAAVKTQSSVTASKVGNLEARWSVKTQTYANGKPVLGGLELISNGQTSEFGILADKFIVYRPDASGPQQVFALGTVNGQTALALNGALVADQVITSRMIGDAEVGTLKIQGQAVTFNVGIYRTDTFRAGDQTTPADHIVMEGSIDCSGAPVNIHVSFTCKPAGDIDGLKDTSHTWYADLIRTKDGVDTTIFSGWIGYAVVRFTNTYGWGLGACGFNRRDSPGAGVVTYKLRVRTGSGFNGLTLFHRSMILSELKR